MCGVVFTFACACTCSALCALFRVHRMMCSHLLRDLDLHHHLLSHVQMLSADPEWRVTWCIAPRTSWLTADATISKKFTCKESKWCWFFLLVVPFNTQPERCQHQSSITNEQPTNSLCDLVPYFCLDICSWCLIIIRFFPAIIQSTQLYSGCCWHQE